MGGLCPQRAPKAVKGEDGPPVTAPAPPQGPPSGASTPVSSSAGLTAPGVLCEVCHFALVCHGSLHELDRQPFPGPPWPCDVLTRSRSAALLSHWWLCCAGAGFVGHRHLRLPRQDTVPVCEGHVVSRQTLVSTVCSRAWRCTAKGRHLVQRCVSAVKGRWARPPGSWFQRALAPWGCGWVGFGA